MGSRWTKALEAKGSAGSLDRKRLERPEFRLEWVDMGLKAMGGGRRGVDVLAEESIEGERARDCDHTPRWWGGERRIGSTEVRRGGQLRS
jgi:hypothetical protein